MRTKALIGLAVLAVSAATCVAQNVYSLNIVGYVNKAVTSNTWYLLENPLTQADNNVTNIIQLDKSAGSPWNNTALFTYTPGQGLVAAETFYETVGWYPGTTKLAPGQGFYLFPKNNGTITFVGEVVLASTNNLAPGFNMVGSPYPASMPLKDLGLWDATDGDLVLRLASGAFLQPVTYYANYGWFDANVPGGLGGPTNGPALDVGEGIWYFNKGAAAMQWKQSFSVGQ